MGRACFALAVAVLLACAPGSKSIAQDDEQLAAADAACPRARREMAVSGSVGESLEDSLRRAGVPASPTREVGEALAKVMDVERDLAAGDTFHVRFEQPYSDEDLPSGDGRVLWAEVVTGTKGTIAFHRFRPAGGAEQFWLADGEAVTTSSMRLPLDTIAVSSGFGMRADPFDRAPPGLGAPASTKVSVVGGIGATVNVATARGIALGLAPAPAAKRSRPAQVFFMHQGVDLVAPLGTRIYAASDGVVTGATANGGYGNWLRIDHADHRATVYGHLLAYAAGIEAGARVRQGQLIGFVGSTGRSTGPHLHFEILQNGAAIDPLSFPGIRRARLQGADLERFRAQVTQALAVRRSEGEGADAVRGDCSGALLKVAGHD